MRVQVRAQMLCAEAVGEDIGQVDMPVVGFLNNPNHALALGARQDVLCGGGGRGHGAGGRAGADL